MPRGTFQSRSHSPHVAVVHSKGVFEFLCAVSVKYPLKFESHFKKNVKGITNVL